MARTEGRGAFSSVSWQPDADRRRQGRPAARALARKPRRAGSEAERAQPGHPRRPASEGL